MISFLSDHPSVAVTMANLNFKRETLCRAFLLWKFLMCVTDSAVIGVKTAKLTGELFQHLVAPSF